MAGGGGVGPAEACLQGSVKGQQRGFLKGSERPCFGEHLNMELIEP